MQAFLMNHWIEGIGYLGTLLTLGTYSMKTMVRLRAFGIAANIVFVVYGTLGAVYPTLVLHLVLLPLNALRLRQMLILLRRVREAARGDLSMDWLRPFAHRRHHAAGAPLWRRGDEAHEMLFVLSGRFRAVESGALLDAGDLIGELGFAVPDNRRTQTVECVEAGDVLTITYDELRTLYFQKPAFGFHFLQLVARRLQGDAAHAGRAHAPASV
jgi:CRP/FNR family cyclic AMP-dependent transcriptional regulator